MQIAQTILQQLGGNRFIAMTGAKNLVAHPSALTFKLPGSMTHYGINFVRVDLTGDDLYVVTFYVMRGLDLRTIRSVAGVYADGLCNAFEVHTGLLVRL